MGSYGQSSVPKSEILVPKIANLGCFVLKSYPKTPKAQNFLDQKYCWIEKVKEEKWFEDLRCGAAMVTEIVKNT